jgi:hypothetical protein
MDSAIASIREAALAVARAKTHFPASHFLDGALPVRGVYLIWDETGADLLYVGRAKDVPERIRQHLDPSSGGLVSKICQERGLATMARRRAHRCGCGKVIECAEGEVSLPRLPDAYAVVDMATRFRVTVLEGDRLVSEDDAERLLQEALLPKYGRLPCDRV